MDPHAVRAAAHATAPPLPRVGRMLPEVRCVSHVASYKARCVLRRWALTATTTPLPRFGCMMRSWLRIAISAFSRLCGSCARMAPEIPPARQWYE